MTEFELALFEEKIRADERKKTIDEFAEKIREYSGKHYIDCDGYGCEKDLVFLTDEFLDDIIEKLKEQK